MQVSVEISYFPLAHNYSPLVSDFIARLESHKNIQIYSGIMSSVIIGDFDALFQVLNQEIRPFILKYPSVFTLKISNSCYQA